MFMNMITEQVSEHVHSIKIPFRIPIGKDCFIERFVYVYLIFEDNILLIDSGVAGSGQIIFDYIVKAGRKPEEIAMTILTHAHADHIGGAPFIKDKTGCTIVAHREDVRWIEDTELQEKERPIPAFKSLVEGNIDVDRVLGDGEIIQFNNNSTIEVIHTPGHSGGHIALWYKKDRVMITGDCVPVRGDMPIYDDAGISLKSIENLAAKKDIAVLLSAWAEPAYGATAYEKLKDAAEYIREVHKAVLGHKTDSEDIKNIAQSVCDCLNLPKGTMNPLFLKTVAAHLKISELP